MQKRNVLLASEKATHAARARYLSVILWWLLGAVAGTPAALLAGDISANGSGKISGNTEERRINALIGEFRNKLGIHEPVAASIVEVNKYLASAQHSSTPGKDFIIEFQRDFLSSLTEEELRVVIAHELGHIWIFTHFPYLQTEALANEKALELVSRESLEKVYEKVWHHQGEKGTLQELLAKVEKSEDAQ